MSTTTSPDDLPPRSRYSTLSTLWQRIFGLVIIDAIAIWFVYSLLVLGGTFGAFLASAIIIVTIGVNVVFLREDLYPLRWLSPGLALMILLVVYPVIFTVFLSLTNYGTGHLISKEEAIAQIEQVTYVPETGMSFTYTAFNSPSDNTYLIWVQSPTGETQLLGPGIVVDPEEIGAGPLDADGIPESIPGYQRLSPIQVLGHLSNLDGIEFGEPPETVRVTSSDTATTSVQRYVYDAEQDIITDQVTGTIYRPINGTFTSEDGQTLSPGFYVTLGLDNYVRLFTSPAFAGPFVLIFIWTVVFALLSVLLTFAAGLFLAIVYDDDSISLRTKKTIRSLLIIPYAIPAFIAVTVWRGLLNPNLGVVNEILEALFGIAPAWFASPFWAKVGILLIQLWLGFPYMMLICTGALQSIPKDLYQAADVDGAGPWSKFQRITLPLVLFTVSPLLVASFAFNFNNFTVIDIYNQGGPPMANSPTPAGHTDILITYTSRLAFGAGGSDFGYASAITVIIFIVLAILTYYQFRRTQQEEEL